MKKRGPIIRSTSYDHSWYWRLERLWRIKDDEGHSGRIRIQDDQRRKQKNSFPSHSSFLSFFSCSACACSGAESMLKSVVEKKPSEELLGMLCCVPDGTIEVRYLFSEPHLLEKYCRVCVCVCVFLRNFLWFSKVYQKEGDLSRVQQEEAIQLVVFDILITTLNSLLLFRRWIEMTLSMWLKSVFWRNFNFWPFGYD